MCVTSCTLRDLHITFQDGATSLFLAAQQGHVTVVRQLISSGAKVNHLREVSGYPHVINVTQFRYFMWIM